MFTNKGSNSHRNQQWELACIDAMVPEDHLLRMIDQHIDFSFIEELVRPYYHESLGRPSIPPVRLFKMMLIGYLYGIRSDRQLEREIMTNVAYRWFLGLGLMDKVPDHSTISWNRRVRFKGTTVFQDIFEKVAQLAIEHHMVGGRLLVTDSTHIQASANKNKFEKQVITQTPQEYLAELEKAVNEDRDKHGKPPLPPSQETPEVKMNKVSTTDPESGYMNRNGKPEGFAYLDHRTVDHKYNIITDTYVTAGNVNDSTVYVDRLKYQVETFRLTHLEAVVLDSGYCTPHICKTVTEMEIFAVIAEKNEPKFDGIFPKKQFTYDRENDQYICPQGQVLHYVTTNRQGYREYHSNRETCSRCPFLSKCTKERKGIRKIQRHVWEDHKEKVIANSYSPEGQAIYKIRKETIERSFADAKELHGLRRTRFRGREHVQNQAYMTAIAQNIKKIARHLQKGVGCFASVALLCVRCRVRDVRLAFNGLFRQPEFFQLKRLLQAE